MNQKGAVSERLAATLSLPDDDLLDELLDEVAKGDRACATDVDAMATEIRERLREASELEEALAELPSASTDVDDKLVSIRARRRAHAQ